MTEPILCLVCLCLVIWVALLKSELAELKQSDVSAVQEPATGVVAKTGAVKGSRSFEIG